MWTSCFSDANHVSSLFRADTRWFGLAEIISVLVMKIYVPQALIPSYILLWRVVVSYLTVIVGSVVFWRWLRQTEEGDDAPLEQGQRVSASSA